MLKDKNINSHENIIAVRISTTCKKSEDVHNFFIPIIDI